MLLLLAVASSLALQISNTLGCLRDLDFHVSHCLVGAVQRGGVIVWLRGLPGNRLLGAVGFAGDSAPRTFGSGGLALGVLAGGGKAGTQDRHDGLDLLGVAALGLQSGAHGRTIRRQAHEPEQKGAALLIGHARKALGVHDVGQGPGVLRYRATGNFMRAVGQRHGGLTVLELDDRKTDVLPLGDQVAVFLFQRDAHRFTGERHADGFLHAGFPGVVVAGDQRYRAVYGDVGGAHAEDVLDPDGVEFHAASAILVALRMAK